MNHGVHTNIALSVSRDAKVEFLVSNRDPDSITLVIGNSLAEITFTPSTIETLLDKAAGALRRRSEILTAV